MSHSLHLSIGGISIQIESPCPPETLKPDFFGKNISRFLSPPPPKEPEIHLQVQLSEPPFALSSEPILFQSRRKMVSEAGLPRENGVTWKLAGADAHYLLKGEIWAGGFLAAKLTQDFREGTVFLRDSTWQISDLTHDFLQVLLIHYLARTEKGVLLHATGLQDEEEGLLFYGRTQSGKSTLARLWARHSQAHLFNDDRILLRKEGSRFLIYATPWNGDFKEYPEGKNGSAELTRAFFLQGHSLANQFRPLSTRQQFESLFPQCFLPFWSRAAVDFVSRFLVDLSASVPIEGLEFADTPEVISFVRNLPKRTRKAPVSV